MWQVGACAHITVEDPVRRVSECDIDELEYGRRKLPHICEVQLDHMVLLHGLCQAAPDLHTARATRVNGAHTHEQMPLHHEVHMWYDI